jgi:hypothetical protein
MYVMYPIERWDGKWCVVNLIMFGLSLVLIALDNLSWTINCSCSSDDLSFENEDDTLLDPTQERRKRERKREGEIDDMRQQ